MILTRRQRGGLTWALCALVLVACSSGPSTRRPRVAAEPRVTQPATATRGVHEVRRGDTLYGIARQHGLDYRELARINAIAPPYRIYPGQKLRLGGKPVRASSRSRPKPTNSRPSTASTAPAPVSAPATPASSPPKPPVASAARPEASASGAAATAQPSATSGWLWPTEGAVLRTFQANDPARQGLKIGGQAGQPVRAAPALPRQGQAIAAIGSPNGLDFSMSAGIVSRHGQVGGLMGEAPMLQIAAPIIGGNSGGPVFNGRGEAVGLVSHGTGPFNQAVPIGRALAVAGL